MTGGVAARRGPADPAGDRSAEGRRHQPRGAGALAAYTGAVADGEATAGYKPQVDLTLGVGREWKDYPGATPTGSRTEYTRTGGSITLTQMLFDGMFTRNEVKRLGYAKLVRYYELLEASENISLEAVKAYADVARRSELVEEARANFLEHKLTAVQIDQKARAGVARRVDLDQANGRLALAESNLLTEISNLHDVSARYLRIMGEKPPTKLPALAEGLKLKGIPASATEAMRIGLPNSPTINAAYENVRSSQSNIETRKSADWPRVDFRIRDSWGRNVDGVDGSRRDQVAEVVLNYNLYRGGYDKARENRRSNTASRRVTCRKRLAAMCARRWRSPTRTCSRSTSSLATCRRTSCRPKRQCRPTVSSSTSASAPCLTCSTRKTSCSRPTAPISTRATTRSSPRPAPWPAWAS